jgi:RNA polymerase sigma factor (TIGR02999 family)
MASGVPMKSMTCRQADGTIGERFPDCGADQARQQARRIGRLKALGSALPAVGRRYFAATFALLVAPMSDVTRILSAIDQGDPHAAEQLLPLVYDELRKLAAAKLAQERPGQTLEGTALVHEAYVRLVDVDQAQKWDSRGHFFAAAAEAMRRILVDRAREKGCTKRGGKLNRLDIDTVELGTKATPDQLLAIDDALAKLAREDPSAAKLVELRYFAGLTVDEAGKALGMSTPTAYRHWNYARAWLHGELLGTAES